MSIFKEMDADGSGCLTLEELMNAFRNDDKIRTQLEALDINVSDVQRLFRLLDANDSGEVDFEEFCDGCAKIKGDASSFDVHCLIYEHRRMHRWMSKFMAHVEGAFQRMSSETQNIGRTISQIPRENTSRLEELHARLTTGHLPSFSPLLTSESPMQSP